MKPTLKSGFSQRGMGLPEAMVALLLLGVAVIGFAALQVRAVSTTGDALNRTQAMAIAQDLSERIRANMAGYTTYTGAWNPAATAANLCEASACTAVQMAQYDIKTVTDLAQAVLPNGQVAMQTCVNGVNACIYVSWNTTTPTRAGGANDCATSAGTYVADASCVMMEVY